MTRAAASRARRIGRLELSVQARRNRRVFDDVRTYCMFIGYPRSGHSLVGALLDAHPNALITHELNALRFMEDRRLSRDQLFWLIARTDEASSEERPSGRYDYSVPGQWQGRHERLQVIGDKAGGATALRLRRDPGLYDRLRSTVGVDVRVIHVVRNPFDNISTLSKKERRPLVQAIERYFTMCEASDQLRRREDVPVLDVRHEDLIEDPERVLAGLCVFVGLDAAAGYLAACGGIVYRSPHRSRTEAPWTDELIEHVRRRMEPFDFLQGYAFDDDEPERNDP